MKEKEMAHIHIIIDEKTKQKAKVKAIRENTNLTEVIKKFIKEWVRR